MSGMDARRIEHEIRTLPGVVACQLTSTTALVLVGPDGDAAAINAAVAKVLESAASTLAMSVLTAPKPAPVISLSRRRRRKAVFAMAGSAAALSASMAAAATMVVLGGVEVDGVAPPAADARQETAAPITLLTEPPLVEQVVPVGRTPVQVAAPAASPAVEAVASADAVLLAIPLPPVLRNLEVSRSAPARKNAAPDPEQHAPAPPVEVALPAEPLVPVVVAASAAPQAPEGPPFGVARRQRRGGNGPSEHASPVATAEGATSL